MALVVSTGSAERCQWSSQVEPLLSFRVMDQLNFLPTNHRKWPAMSLHTLPLLAPRRLHHQPKMYQSRSLG
jgi:hypothetical protein